MLDLFKNILRKQDRIYGKAKEKAIKQYQNSRNL